MIYKHSTLQLPAFISLSACYIIFKFSLSPFLWVLRKAGLKSDIPKQVDSIINRSILPLTESSAKLRKAEERPGLDYGDKLPSTQISFSDGTNKLLDTISKHALLLIFIRGSWCSYSRLHLSDIFSKADHFKRKDIELVVITSYADQEWWNKNEIVGPMILDEGGKIFNQFGIRVKSWIEFAWGRIIPHESAFLFSNKGELIEFDVRKVNSLIPGQKFLGADAWLEIADMKL